MFFTICNIAIAQIARKVGPYCMFYFSGGSLVTGFIYHLYMCILNFKTSGVFWNNQNLIIDGKLRWRNVFGFVVFMIQYFLVQNLVFFSMWIGDGAGMNVAIPTCIWMFNPLFSELCDRFIYQTPLRYYHALSFGALILCVVSLFLSPSPTE